MKPTILKQHAFQYVYRERKKSNQNSRILLGWLLFLVAAFFLIIIYRTKNSECLPTYSLTQHGWEARINSSIERKVIFLKHSYTAFIIGCTLTSAYSKWNFHVNIQCIVIRHCIFMIHLYNTNRSTYNCMLSTMATRSGIHNLSFHTI